MDILTKADIQSCFTMQEAIDAAKQAYQLYTQGKANAPLRTALSIPESNGQSLFMPAYVAGINALGIKIVSIFADNQAKGLPTIPAQMLVLDADTGVVQAMLDGTYLTQLRTGALAGAATDVLANEDAKQFALIGTGGQAMCQLDAVVAVRNIEHISVFSSNTENTLTFINTAQRKYPQIMFTMAQDSADCIADADIITTVTTAKAPTFDGNLVKAGAHINGIGSFTPAMQEIDTTTLNRAVAVYCDTKAAVLAEAGDFIIPINQNKFSTDKITGEMGELLLQTTTGRTKPTDITVFKTVGSAVFDVVTAHLIYQKYQQLNR